ncbi:MAG: substrate-binding domain-containing protein [Muribaculaceae bacterium]|nr:substrate-binding domain-containing protein [Muribaculaceae bacterium]
MIKTKNPITLTILCLTALAALLTMAGCAEKKVYRIGVSQCSSDDWRSKMNDEIYRELIFHDNATVEIRSADDSNDKQIADIRYFADNGFDIIIAAPNEADALTPVIKEVYERGIPVLIFDRNIHGDSFTAYQGADNTAIGRSAAMLAGSLTAGPCKVLEIQGLKGSTPAEDRHRGFADAVALMPQMQVIADGYGNWTGTGARSVVDSLASVLPEINLIYAHNDRMAIAASEKVRELGYPDIKIIGIDAAPEIGIQAVADSIIDATFLYPTEGYTLIRTAMAILEGKDYNRLNKLPAATVVDISNADMLLLQNEELKEETDKITWLKSRVDEYWDRHSAQTGLLYAVIAILVLLFILAFGLLRAFWTKKRHQTELAARNKTLGEQRDRLIALNEQLQEATQSKLMFFTNVSHDLRTPLTLIAGPIEQLAEAGNLTAEQHTMLRIANKNVKILKRLINQVLDFRKYESGKLSLNLSEVDLPAVLAEWCESFRGIAVSRDIRFAVHTDTAAGLTIAIDVEKVERVMFNLISNAFKYTPANGSIDVALSATDSEVRISVTDTGKGISAEDLSHIFERFFQVDKIHPNGSGIGLSLAKSFIELHQGTLAATSEPGKGSTFIVTLPVRHIEGAAAAAPASSITAADVKLELEEITAAPAEVDKDRTVVLVIDDNPDIRALIATELKDSYTVITTSDGIKGIKMAAKYIPDLIICDVMMPLMDGLECCRRLKSEKSTSHIPVLMLTACTMDEQRIQGYECGADAYLPKPFDRDVLLARCRSLIENRRRILSLTAADIPTGTKEAAPSTATDGGAVGEIDSDFYRRFTELVDAEMSNQELSVDSIAREMGLGRTQFYRKIKALTNYSPVELLRNIRLAKARTLLTTSDKTISEIAYEVGFSTPAYFSKCYRDRYGETPTDIRSRLR